MAHLVDFIALIGLIETLVLLLYAARYYLFTYISIKSKNINSDTNPGHSGNPHRNSSLSPYPFISVLLPVYNEKNVVDRLLSYCTNFDYPLYELVVIDDSIDETTEILSKWKNHSKVKLIHRNSRKGWKGGALNTGLEQINPKSKYILIFDADFVPPPDLINRFLKRFEDNSVTVVQGYQVHDLNAEENWITKAYRVMFSVTNMVELYAKNKLKLLLSITGSVYMIRTDILKKLRFNECLTEDWELTLRLYEAGYKVLYDSTLMVSAECPNTLLKIFRQNIRWAEGHTRSTFRQHFWKILRSEFLTLREKIDFLFQGGIYLNSFLLLASSLGGILVLPSLVYALSLSYVLVTLLFVVIGIPSIIIASTLALSLENRKKDYGKIPNLLLLGFISTPVTAYASLKGLFTGMSPWYRTGKTGNITKQALISPLKKLFKSHSC